MFKRICLAGRVLAPALLRYLMPTNSLTRVRQSAMTQQEQR